MKFEHGLFTDIPAKVYHAMTDVVSNSYLSRLDSCPAKAKVEQSDTPAMLFGRALHSYVLEGEAAFLTEFAVLPEGLDLRTKAGKEVMTDFQLRAAGKELIKAEDFWKIRDIRLSVMAHPLAGKILKKGTSESSAFWTDHETGIKCKCRPDWSPQVVNRCLIDLKSTTDASIKGFQRSVVQYGYYRQAAWYIDGLNAAAGLSGDETIDSMLFIVVEKDAPYRVECYLLSDDFVELGRKECRRLLELEKKCRENNDWPNYTSSVITEIDAPAWMVV